MQPAALIVIAPLVLVLALFAAGQWIALAQAPPQACGDKQIQEQTRAAMFIALDEGFRQHITSLYAVWMKDRGAPTRAKAGIDQAVGTYLYGYKAVETWSLPPCR